MIKFKQETGHRPFKGNKSQVDIALEMLSNGEVSEKELKSVGISNPHRVIYEIEKRKGIEVTKRKEQLNKNPFAHGKKSIVYYSL